jgi:general secretion pathway protein M
MIKASLFARKAAAIAILMLIAGAVWLVLIRPLIDSFMTYRESIAQSQEMLAKYQRLDASRSKIDANLQELRSAQESEARVLKGGSTQLVGAELQNHLKGLIESHNANLVSMQVLPVREEQRFQRISMAVTLRATINALQPILFAIEDQSPYLFVEDLELRSNRGFIAESEEQALELQVQFVVFGYMAIGTG